MENKEKILEMYYRKHLKQVEILKILNVSKQYVSKVIKADSRYKYEKANRKKVNAKKRKEYLKDYFKTYCRPKKAIISNEDLKLLQVQDAKELSYYSEISDMAFAKWNQSIYHSNKKGNLVIDPKAKVSSDIPKRIDRDGKLPTQKYKKRYCHSF